MTKIHLNVVIAFIAAIITTSEADTHVYDVHKPTLLYIYQSIRQIISQPKLLANRIKQEIGFLTNALSD